MFKTNNTKVANFTVYIVYLGDRRRDEPELVQESHHAFLSDILGSKEAAKESILYSYKHGFSGFAAVLTKSQAKLIADFPGIVGVIQNKILTPHTTRSWDFLHVKSNLENGILSKSHFGVGSIIGVLDTGIWPESKSFVDEGIRELKDCQEGAPSAWLAVYKVCWATGGCSSADVLAAFDDAVFDGVDVLSVSIGSTPPLATYVEDPVAIGSFHAVAKGITVVCSAGNSGPYPQTVINTAPWVITVAASTIDRAFPTRITLGNNQTVVGQALYTGNNLDEFHPLVNGEDIAASDADADSARNTECHLARGKVIVCFQSWSQRSGTTARRTVLDVQGVGLIFAQFPDKDVILSLDIPSVQVDFAIATYLLAYMEASRNPIVKFSFTKTAVGKQISPEVASSPLEDLPDIAAPGVNILASWSPASPVIFYMDEYGQNIIAEGAPHKQADPFDYGGGHVDPNKALNPGLIYDLGISDYVRFLCSMGYNNSAISLMTQSQTVCQKSTKSLANLNLPSITVLS
ncbi:hypothetical protein GH714_031250 [Hevea brasiliensis]|uniref:Inhibitor I9 domain-containing protein n=1 Tax=Hevea brasiliensis TaxID=3981 RepID=A0A6A6NCX1_HEVBR|nr:hypothetical protein GH714_031250 [Hevea brasiliensis]